MLYLDPVDCASTVKMFASSKSVCNTFSEYRDGSRISKLSMMGIYTMIVGGWPWRVVDC